ncbi:hypothetical protein [Natronoflexus pectinivorans]|uniref:Uncharacterized protein n=1 Tax=Natronoflexus pectinivorans TaxID=682526 RepID=A0A4V6NMQ6_9BACT|nr:hypothetical protein [Natronoflexus pectinivorans]TCO08406.1 hypothetical protein EV194_105211 [Natronoflexus pectinivorans]
MDKKILVSDDWIRNVSINLHKVRLLCVGDDRKLYEWNIENLNNIRLLNQTRISRNWVLALDVGMNGDIECWGGLDHSLKVRTHFGTYEKRLNEPILKVEIINNNSSEVFILACVLSKGIQNISLREMKLHSL